MYSFIPSSKNCLIFFLFTTFFCAQISHAQRTQDEKERLIKASQEYYLAKNNGLISPDFQLGTKKMYKYLNDGNVIVIQLRIQAAQAPLNVENPFEKLENDVKKRQGQPHPSENDLKFSFKEFGEIKTYGGKSSITDIELFAGWTDTFSQKVVFFSENPPPSIKKVKREKLSTNEIQLIDSLFESKKSKEFVVIAPDKKVQYISREEMLNLEYLVKNNMTVQIHYVAKVKQNSNAGVSEANIEVKPSLGEEPYGYKWNSGQTTALIKDLPGGKYICTITDSKGNKRITDTILIRTIINQRSDSTNIKDSKCIGCVSQDEELEKSLSIYPNPTNGKVNIEFKNKRTPINITISDVTGRKIIFYQSFTGSEINLSTYSEGVYTISVSNDTASFSKKILLTK